MITSLEHTALSVRDLERSLAFYRDVLGMKVIRELEPGLGGEKLGILTAMPHCRAWIVHLDLGGSILELFQYFAPEGRPIPLDRQQADLGFIHIGLSSTDVYGDYRRLKAHRVEFLSEPVEFRPGVSMVYFRGPDGEVCELRQSDKPLAQDVKRES